MPRHRASDDGLLPTGLQATRGKSLLAGENVLAVDEARLQAPRCTRMSMIFQEPMTALNPVMRCGDQTATKCSLRTRRSCGGTAWRKAGDHPRGELPNPARMMASYPHQLSGGQRQRIMIAMALVLEPALLIADEPTTALDVTTQAQILALIRELMREHGTGVLFITHDFGVVAEIADRVAVLRTGELLEIGATRELLTAPRHAYTKMLIAAGAEPHAEAREVVTAPSRHRARIDQDVCEPVGFGALNTRQAAARRRVFDIAEARPSASWASRGRASRRSPVHCAIGRAHQRTDRHRRHRFRARSRARNCTLRRKVQIVFQDPYRSLNPRRTVGAAIVEGPMNYGASQREALDRARQLMELVRLDPKVLDRYPHQFSGGQRQRICIARSLAMEPDLLIADEAVSALDVSIKAQVIALLDEIRRRLDLAMLFITHDLRVAAQVCDRVAVMTHGRIVEYGPIAEVFAHPRDAYTSALLAAAPGRGWDFSGGLARPVGGA
jgi:peptide/nickel transport system ATP-binding protein